MTVLSKILSPAPLLYLLVVLAQFANGVYLGAQLELPAAVTVLYLIGLLWVSGWWLQTDSRRAGVLSVYDIGLFLYLAWPFVMPYYLVKTRGVKGLLFILGFIGAYIGAAIIGVILSVFVTTMR